MELKREQDEGSKFGSIELDTFQSYKQGKRKKRNLKLFLQEVLRKAMEVFVGVTLLSLLVTLFTGMSVVHSYPYYAASTFLFPLLTRVLQRKYMFFLCNLILVFLLQPCSRRRFEGHHAMNLVQQGNLIIIDHQDRHEEEDEEEEYKALGVVTEDPGDSEKQVANQGVGVTTDLIEEEEEEDSDEQKALAMIGKQGEIDKDSSQLLDSTLVGDEEKDEAEKEMGGAGGSSSNSIESTEELNKKVEEFIRKMKRELQLEVDAHSPQLIAASS